MLYYCYEKDRGRGLAAERTVQAPEAVALPDTIGGQVPNVSGLGAREAVALLEAQGLKVRIHGQGRVSRQSVAAGSKVVRGQEVTLELKR